MDTPLGREQDGAHDGPAASARPGATATSAGTAAGWPPQEILAPDGTASGDHAAPAGGARNLKRRRVAAAALLAVALAAIAIVLLSGGRGNPGAPATGVPAGYTTATVTRRTLTESSTVDGTLGYGATLELYDHLAGTFTWLPAVGATIARGGTLFRVNNLPVVLMYGTLPAYRTLKQGVSGGPDVAQLNRNLIDLGYDPDGSITEPEDFGAATAAAVRRWQTAQGLPQTGRVELGRVVFAAGARRVTAVHVALGQDPPAAESPPAGSSGHGAPASNPGSGDAPQGPPRQKTPTRKGRPKAHKPKRSDKGMPGGGQKPNQGADKPGASEPAESSAHEAAKDSPSKDGSNESSGKPAGGSEPAAAGEPVLATTSTQQLVQVKLKAEQQQLAHVGERAPVTLPGGGVVQGTIVAVGTVASEAKSPESEHGGSSGEPSGEATIPVTLALAHRVTRLDQAPVSVELVKEVRRDVLAVPATALTATAGGRYAIELLERDRRVELPVTPGMFANGYVQVEGPGLHEGQTVVQSE